MPVCPRALRRWPALFAELDGRHVCLITEAATPAAETAATAALLSRLAVRSARSHLCVSISRGSYAADGVIHLDSLGMTSMTTMTYVDSDFGPSTAELFDAARKAEGIPGRFLSRLAGQPFEPAGPSYAVHETPAEYGTAAAHSGKLARGSPRERSRIGSGTLAGRQSRGGARVSRQACRRDPPAHPRGPRARRPRRSRPGRALLAAARVGGAKSGCADGCARPYGARATGGPRSSQPDQLRMGHRDLLDG